MPTQPAQGGLPRHVGILIVSDRRAAGLPDEAGPPLADRVRELFDAVEVHILIVPDEESAIAQALLGWSDASFALILTSGGTGFAPRDITPDVTRKLIERPAPGLVVAMLTAGLAVTPHAMLSRPEAGLRGRSLIVNLPGSPKGALESLEAIAPALPHGLALLHDGHDDFDHQPPG